MPNAAMWIRKMHHVHRALGSALALLLAMWFASGAVMTFARYPSYTESERLAHARSLPFSPRLVVPEELRRFMQAGGLRDGARARLSMVAEQPTWLWGDEHGQRRALPAIAGHTLTVANQSSLLRDVTLRLGAAVRSSDVIKDFDQWTVGSYFRPWFPLLRINLDDDADTQVYVSLRTGEIVQQSTGTERVLAWLGPIPHWIYPAALRNHPATWHYVVLTLATLGLMLSLSGMVAGLHVWRVARRKRPRPDQQGNALRDPYLLWHQRLGLLFGLLVSTWLFSGALSLSPFEWSRGAWPDEVDLSRVHTVELRANESLPVANALAACRRQLDVRELELVGFAGSVFAICADGDGHTRLVNLSDSTLIAAAHLDANQLDKLEHRLAPAGHAVEATLAYQPDNYHYPTHQDATFGLPFARLTVHDREQTTYYIDPASLRLLSRHTLSTRFVRWLYHGLHSFDLPALYAQRVLWRGVVIFAMTVGFTLSMLGFGMSVRRARRGRRVRSSARS